MGKCDKGMKALYFWFCGDCQESNGPDSKNMIVIQARKHLALTGHSTIQIYRAHYCMEVKNE